MPRHSNFYDDEDLDDEYEYDEDENGQNESDDPVHQLADFIIHGIDAESSQYILSIFPLIKKPEGEPFLVDILERCDGDFEACINEIYEMAQKEEERKKKSAVNIVVKSNNSKTTGNKNNSNKAANTTKATQQQPAATSSNSQKKNDNKKQSSKKKDNRNNIILVSELDNFTEISGTPTPTSEVSENIFTGMFNFILIV
ncbi:hypothetical protein NAEGRDRAFT_63006 [Naegleria gruberi]|uniref:Uncharacterized protein n=1 Tax=Naegleria gruberi TaxID=5762 RepID=D2V2H9_NAEGR|nr:uncharacterized protein NAEGRDRAFT_63006 [Naegleria gruberi]EFC49061.1 hypothetical protein NAEGRDRAFT_63006 [Naegleria gruberi]|eukprot:XP_002681805.1 hypothetical protein NAEGRDRAFT_63006 [Naegleria gruberi strain NEG-M]